MSVAQKKETEVTQSQRKILAPDFKRADVSRPAYRIVIRDNDTTVEDVLKASYWAHVASNFSKDSWSFAIVELIWEDSSKFLQVMVMEAGINYAKVKVINFIDFEKMSLSFDGNTPVQGAPVEDEDIEDANSDFEVVFRGGAKWSVVRKADKQVMVERLGSKGEAAAWVLEHVKTLNT